MPDSPTVGFQITSDPDTTSVAAPRTEGGTERPGERRCRLLFVGDLDPQAPEPDWGADPRVRAVDASSFADVLRDWSPALDVSVEDHLAGGGRRTVTWTVDAMEALTPAGIVARVPALAAVAEAREAIADAKAGRLTLDALRDRLRATGLDGADALADAVAARPGASTPAPARSDDDRGGDRLDGLLGLVSVDGAPDAPGADAPGGVLDALVGAAMGERAASGIDAAQADRVRADLDARLRAQVVALLDDPDVRRLEGAWRGLKFLVDRLAFRRGARLDVLAAPKASLDEALHFQVLLPEHEHGTERDPLAAIVVAHDVTATSADLALLGELAATGGSLQVPVVLSAAPSFFGLDAPTDLARLPPLATLLGGIPYAAFRSLRARPDAAFLSLAVPPFVLRPAYGPDLPDRAHGVEGGEVLWGGGALLAGAALALRHAESGWPTPTAGQAVEDLHVRTTRMGAMPLAAAFSESVLGDLARAGFVGFAGPLRTDRAVMGPPAVVGQPADGSHEAAQQRRLPSAAFSAVAAHRALGLGPELAGMDAEAALAEIERRFQAFLHTGSPLPDDAVTVQHLDEHETETSRTYGVRLRPPADVLPGAVGVVFGVEVPKAASDGS